MAVAPMSVSGSLNVTEFREKLLNALEHFLLNRQEVLKAHCAEGTEKLRDFRADTHSDSDESTKAEIVRVRGQWASQLDSVKRCLGWLEQRKALVHTSITEGSLALVLEEEEVDVKGRKKKVEEVKAFIFLPEALRPIIDEETKFQFDGIATPFFVISTKAGLYEKLQGLVAGGRVGVVPSRSILLVS
jgi:hypothetical protein